VIVTYNIGIIAARVKLTAIQGLHGGVLHAGVRWTIARIGKPAANQQGEYVSENPQTQLDVLDGSYKVSAHYQEEDFELGQLVLEKNTLTDAVFILKKSGEYNAEEGYYSDIDELIEHGRRGDDRSEQAKHGNATTPLREPYSNDQQGDLGAGQQVKAHPLLKNSAQFDGMEDKVNPEPSENNEAFEKGLELQRQAQPGPSAAPTPRPKS